MKYVNILSLTLSLTKLNHMDFREWHKEIYTFSHLTISVSIFAFYFPTVEWMNHITSEPRPPLISRIQHQDLLKSIMSLSWRFAFKTFTHSTSQGANQFLNIMFKALECPATVETCLSRYSRHCRNKTKSNYLRVSHSNLYKAPMKSELLPNHLLDSLNHILRGFPSCYNPSTTWDSGENFETALRPNVETLATNTETRIQYYSLLD